MISEIKYKKKVSSNAAVLWATVSSFTLIYFVHRLLKKMVLLSIAEENGGCDKKLISLIEWTFEAHLWMHVEEWMFHETIPYYNPL